MSVMCVIQNFLSLLCEHMNMNMKQFDAEFAVQKGQIECKKLINWTLELKNHYSIDSPHNTQYNAYQITINIFLRESFNVFNVFSLLPYYIPFEKNQLLHLNKLELPLSKNSLR